MAESIDVESIDFLNLKKHGISKEVIDYSFVYQYPPTIALPKAKPEEFLEDLGKSRPESSGGALYIHIPFCSSLCAYCHYFKTPVPKKEVIEKYLAGLKKEILSYASLLKGKINPDSVFFGGGTPTILEAGQLNELLQFVSSSLELRGEKEVTLESSPETLSKEKLAELRQDGFNRLSIGVQSFDDALLARVCGRKHDSKDAVNAVADAREAGFDNINIDLIYGLPGQTIKHWSQSLDKVKAIDVESATVSDLRVQKGTAMYARDRTDFPSEREIVSMHALAIERLVGAGYTQEFPYQFVKPGFEFRFLETQWGNREFLGFGASACSYLNGWVYFNHFPLDNYLKAVETRGTAISYGKKISEDEKMVREVVLGLKRCGVNRKENGISKKRFRERFGLGLGDAFGKEFEKLEELGLVEDSGDRVALSGKGLLFHNQVAREFYSKEVARKVEGAETR